MKLTEIKICGLPFKFSEWRRLGVVNRQCSSQCGEWYKGHSIVVRKDFWGIVISYQKCGESSVRSLELESDDFVQDDADEYYKNFKLSNELKEVLPQGAQQQKRRSL